MLIIIVAIIGLIFFYAGYRNIRNIAKLKKYGKRTVATVSDIQKVYVSSTTTGNRGSGLIENPYRANVSYYDTVNKIQRNVVYICESQYLGKYIGRTNHQEPIIYIDDEIYLVNDSSSLTKYQIYKVIGIAIFVLNGGIIYLYLSGYL